MPESSFSHTVIGLLSAACSIASSCHSECTTRPEIMLDDQRQLIGFENAFEQQHRRTNASGAQLQRFFDAGDGKPVGLGFQRLGATHRAMAVGIGLDHRQRLGAGDFAGNSVVVAQGL